MRQLLFPALALAGIATATLIPLTWGNMTATILLGLILAILIALPLLLHQLLFAPLAALHTQAVAYATGQEATALPPVSGEIATLHSAMSHLGKIYQEKATLTGIVLGNIITPMVIVDKLGNIEWLNESMVRLTEQDGKPEQFVGTHFAQFFYNESRQTTSDKAIATRERQFVKTQMQSHQGNTKYISVASVPILDARGEVRGAFSSVMDFTNVKLKEDQIMAQNQRIATAARQVMDIAHQVAALAQELNTQVTASEQQAETQQIRTSEVATAIDQMNASIFEVAKNASTASSVATRTESTVQEGVKVVGDVITVMSQVRTQADVLKQEMNGLGAQADGIGRIISVINDIADQTNLLALNAAIEAARAGNAGRGFAVVADEVRKLAEKTMLATREVGSYITTIQNSTRTSIQATDSTGAVIDRAAGLTQSANTALHTILDLVGSTNDQVRSIATATEEQSAASEQIGKSTNEVNAIAQQNVQAMQIFQHKVESLAGLAANLDQAMHHMLAQE